MKKQRRRNLVAALLYLFLLFCFRPDKYQFLLNKDGILFVFFAWCFMNSKILIDHWKSWTILKWERGLLKGKSQKRISSYLPGIIITILAFPYLPGTISFLLPLELAMMGEEIIDEWISI